MDEVEEEDDNDDDNVSNVLKKQTEIKGVLWLPRRYKGLQKKRKVTCCASVQCCLQTELHLSKPWSSKRITLYSLRNICQHALFAQLVNCQFRNTFNPQQGKTEF